MRFRNAWVPCALITLSLCAAPAAAQGKGQGKGHAKQQTAKAQKAPKAKHEHGKPKTADTPHMRFHGLDRNSDGIISRAEWSGNDRSFGEADWNGDGMLSGDEVRPGAKRPSKR